VVILRFATTYGPGKTTRHGNRGVTSQIIEAPFHGRPFSIEQGGDPCDDFIDNKSSALGIYLATAPPPRAWLGSDSETPTDKRFLVLFFKKEPLSSLPFSAAMRHLG